jgi:Ca2+-binding RTX toxin-like protein
MAGRASLSMGNDTVTASSLVGAYIDGLAGDDIISGGNMNDTLLGGEGNDTLYEGDGDNTLYGGNGDSLLISGSFAAAYTGAI